MCYLGMQQKRRISKKRCAIGILDNLGLDKDLDKIFRDSLTQQLNQIIP